MLSEKIKDIKFEVGVGMSRKWNAREAGREVAKNTIDKLNSNPDFFLLFSTIHYEKNGGFQEFLDGVWEFLPEGTPLIGGTVYGFMCQNGCFGRGASALAVSYPNMDVSIGLGKNTKRRTKKAADECANGINKGLNNSSYKNGFVFDLISAALVPKMPGIEQQRIINGVAGNIAGRLYSTFSIMQKGSGKEDELLEAFIDSFNNYHVLSGSSMDDMKMLNNYQFYNNQIHTNAIVGIGIKSDLGCDTYTTHGMKKTSKTFNITKTSKDKRLIQKINGKPARDELIKILGWPEEYLDEKLYRRVIYYPIGFEYRNKIIPEIIGSFVGKNILVTWKVKNSEMMVLTIDGKSLLNSVEKNLENYNGKKTLFALMCSCGIRLETLGSDVYKVKEYISNYFGETPFLKIYVAGESTYSDKRGFIYGNDTLNTAVFFR